MKLYSIGQASAMIDVPVRTIRYYESIGLCVPSVTDESSGYRYYSIDDIFRLDLIRCLGRQLGMPLKTIEDYLKESGSPEELEKYLSEQEKDIDSQIEALMLRKNFLSAKLDALRARRETPPMTPRLVHRPRREIYVGTAEVKSLEDAMLFARKLAAQYGDGSEGQIYLLADAFVGSLSPESGSPVTAGISTAPNKKGLEAMELPEGDYLSIHYYNGPGIREAAVEELRLYMEEHGLERAGPVINGGSLLDMSSCFSKDYYFATEFLVKLTIL